MEITIIENDILTYSLAATSFPEGIMEAHQKLHAIVPFSTERRYFGISRPENGEIKYWSAAEILQEDGNIKSLENFIIRKGNYINREIKNFRNKIPEIAHVFQELLQHPNIDPDSYCLEWYINNDLKCMVKII